MTEKIIIKLAKEYHDNDKKLSTIRSEEIDKLESITLEGITLLKQKVAEA